ncbi:uncharacterized protein LOC142321443 [Lycorma delicatula]|uniref:uncharacterized protein LOC142321443 n=1 Tax=Lycorma delicatula TaxID=130591 RepID=UPI003F514685
MNAADDQERLAGSAVPSCSSGGSSSSNHSNCSTNSNSGMYSEHIEHNDCSRQSHSNSTVCNGAHPKAQPLACNIPNGIAHNNYALKLNNNVSVLDGDKMHNGNGMDLYMRNNVDYCVPVEKCPPKVRKHLNEDSDNSRLYNKKEEEEDSLSENEEEDEYCIYTYKGDQNQMADLPSSFFRLGVIPPGRENNEDRSSSPDMDYLEMDFDPGLSNGRGDSSDDSDCCDMQHDAERPLDDCEDDELRRQSVSPTAELEAVIEDNNDEMEKCCEMSNGKDDFFSNLKPFGRRRLEQRERGGEEEGQEDISDNDIKEDNQLSVVLIGEPKNDLSGCGKLNKAVPSTSSIQQPQPSQSTCISVPISPPAVRDSWGYHCSSGDLCSPGDPSENNIEGWGENAADYFKTQGENAIDTRKYNLRSALYHCIMAKRLVLDKQASFSDSDHSNLDDKQADSPDSNRPVERTMIWSEQEACAKQVTQIGTSLCGATAVINVMVALNLPFSLEKLKEGVATNFRNENSAVPEYLFSRSLAGATHHDLIRGIEVASQGSLYARFFHMYPERNVCLSTWLSSWMKKGAIPIATINLQKGVGSEGTIPDVWHHQMVFGVGPRGIYLTNPLECIPEKALMVQLCSPPTLKIRRADILSRWTPSTDLRPLIKHPDVRWKRINVLGQVVNVIREAQWSRQGLCSRTLTSHVSIPASYSSGITLVIPRENPAYDLLREAPELLVAT